MLCFAQLKALDKVPMVLWSPLRQGKISEVVGRIFLGSPAAHCMPRTGGGKAAKVDHVLEEAYDIYNE